MEVDSQFSLPFYIIVISKYCAISCIAKINFVVIDQFHYSFTYDT